jgi:hypothetical protein
VCAPNRIGLEKIKSTAGKPVNEDGIEFWGQSFVAAPDGQVVERAPSDRETVMVVDCDLSRVEFSRTHWPFLRDRRSTPTATSQPGQRLCARPARQHGFSFLRNGAPRGVDQLASSEGISFDRYRCIDNVSKSSRDRRFEADSWSPNALRSIVRARCVSGCRAASAFTSAQRMLDATRPGVRAARAARAHRGRRRGLGLQRVGRQVPAVR